ncbi:hypothetical protein [Hymenobacter sp. BT559]|uniref:hypothetical protein n=1 Tax=Hymenobacter sp. BT559 TaxID=2795729 RepID=UPI0018EA4A2B|nr:hypothetical protein [Hymenobacter sp. BT559]MBJ6142214.1 hypothetical protein [Hymenobacter sp. BT559]
MRTLLLCLCACLCLFSCKKEDPEGIFIRVRNASQYPLENIVFVDNPQHTYGALSSGQISDYQSYARASYLPSVTVTAQGEELPHININDMPVAGLEPGRYTYVLDVIKDNRGGNRLTVSLEQP